MQCDRFQTDDVKIPDEICHFAKFQLKLNKLFPKSRR